MMEPEITWYGQSAIGIDVGGLRIAIDPLRIPAGVTEVDVLLISRDHPDHFSVEDIARVAGTRTAIFASPPTAEKLQPTLNARVIEPGDVVHYGALTIRAVPAYHVESDTSSGALAHPAEGGAIGFVLEIDDLSFYFAGDTGVIPEMEQIGPVDYAFLPVSGGSVMTPEEAARAASMVQPSIAIPIHLGVNAGSVEDARRFSSLVPDQIRVWILEPARDFPPSQP